MTFPPSPPRLHLSFALLLLLAVALTGCGSGFKTVSTSVEPLASEDLRTSCTYDLLLSPANALDSDVADVKKGVLVLFERGDTDDLYTDTTLRNAMQAMHFAIVWAHECDARTFDDLQSDASKGPTRALFTALSNFAQLTDHPELNNAGVFLYGFSAAGVLSASMANDHPQRLLGSVQYAAGSSYFDLDDLAVTAGGATVPSLVLANADDNASGTMRSFRYFQRGRALSAPWAYAVQNSTKHCCTLSTRDVILPWMQTLVASSSPIGLQPSMVASASASGMMARFICTPDGVQDAQGETNCRFTAASLQSTQPAAGLQDMGWLPGQTSGTAWLAWVTNSATN